MPGASPWEHLATALAKRLPAARIGATRAALLALGLSAAGALAFLHGSGLGLAAGALLVQASSLAEWHSRRAQAPAPGAATLRGLAGALRPILAAAALTQIGVERGQGGVAVLGAALFLGAALLEARLPALAREAARGLGDARRAQLDAIEQMALRCRDALARRGLAPVLFGRYEREALALTLAPLLGWAAGGMLAGGLLALPFLALAFSLLLAAHKGAPPVRAHRPADRTLLVVGLGATQRAVLAAARGEEVAVWVVEAEDAAGRAGLADHVLCVPPADADAVRDAVRSHARLFPPIGGVLCAGRREAAHTAALLARDLGVQGLDLGAARILSDKRLLRPRLAGLGLAPLPYRLADEPAQVEDLFASGPVVLKAPRPGGGSRLFLLKDAEDLERAWPEARALAPAGPLLAECHAPGRDVGVAAVVQEGNVVFCWSFDRLLAPLPEFGRTGLLLAPSSLEPRRAALVEALAQRTAQGLGVGSGPLYLELRVPETGPAHVIDVEAAVPGQLVTSYLVPESSGVDYPRACVRAALGRAFEGTPVRARTAACRFVHEESGPLALDDLLLCPIAEGGEGAPRRALLASGSRRSVRRLLAGLR